VLYGRQHEIKKEGISRLSYRTKQARGRNFSYKAQETDIAVQSINQFISQLCKKKIIIMEDNKSI